MGPRAAGFLVGTLVSSLIMGHSVERQLHTKNELSKQQFEGYEREIQLLQQRMDVVQRGFALLRKIQ